MGERLWFQNAVEGLFVRDLRGVLTKEHRAELKRLGIDLERLLPAYPVDTFRRGLELVAPLVAPNQPAFEQQRELGRRLTRGYFDTLLGQALAKIAGLVGPARGLSRIDRNFRSITNYLDVKVIEQQARSASVSFTPVDGLSGLLLGIAQASGNLLERPGQSTSVTLVTDVDDRAVMRFEWFV